MYTMYVERKRERENEMNQVAGSEKEETDLTP